MQVNDTSKRFLICKGNLKSNQRDRVEVEAITNLLRVTYNTLRPLIYNKQSQSRTAEIVNIAKPFINMEIRFVGVSCAVTCIHDRSETECNISRTTGQCCYDRSCDHIILIFEYIRRAF